MNIKAKAICALRLFQLKYIRDYIHECGHNDADAMLENWGILVNGVINPDRLKETYRELIDGVWVPEQA